MLGDYHIFVVKTFVLSKKSKGGDMTKWPMVTSIFILIAASCSYGYIDLGSGSYMVQVLLAGLIGSLYGLKGWIKKIVKTILSLINKRKQPN
jgi:hypothetical protein